MWDITSGEVLWKENGGRTDRVWDLAFAPSGSVLAVARGDGTIDLRDTGDGRLIRTIGDLAQGLPVAIAFSPSGRRMASATARTAISLWEIPSGRSILTLSRRSSTAGAIAFAADGQAIITGDVHGTVSLWPTVDSYAEVQKAK